MSMNSTERSVEKIWTEADDVDEPLSPTLVTSADSADAVDRNDGQMDAEEVIKIMDGLKNPWTVVKSDSSYSDVVQEGLEPNIFDRKSDATHNCDGTKEEVRMWEKTTDDVDDIWAEAHAVTEPPSPALIPTDESAGSIEAVVEVDVQMDDKREIEAVTGSEKSPPVIKMESVCSNGSAEDMYILTKSKEEVEDIWAEAVEVVEPINLPTIMTSESMRSIDDIVVLLDAKVIENVVVSNENEIMEEVNMVGTKEEVEDIWAEAEEVVEPINLPSIMTCESIGNTDEVVVLLDVKVTEDVAGSNENEIKEELNMVSTNEEVEHIWIDAEEVVEPVNLPPIMTYDSMGSADEIAVLSDVKVAEAVEDSNRNEVKKEGNMWVETKEEIEKICAESKEVVEPIILPSVMTDNSLGSVDKIVVFLNGRATEDVVDSNIYEVKKEVNLWVDTKEEVEEIWSKAEEVLEPLSPLPEILKESMASVDQMDVRNVTQAAVDLDEPPQVCGIDTTDMENISAGMNTVDKPAITEKLGKLPGIEESVETVLRAGISYVESPRQGCRMMSEVPGNGVGLIKVCGKRKIEVECKMNRD